MMHLPPPPRRDPPSFSRLPEATAGADEQRAVGPLPQPGRAPGREANRIAAACAGTGGIKYCDQLSLREAKRVTRR